MKNLIRNSDGIPYTTELCNVGTLKLVPGKAGKHKLKGLFQ